MAPLLAAVAGPIIKGIFGIVDQVVEDKDKASEIKAKIAERQQNLIEVEIKGAVDIILAESQGSWLQKNWRPLLMLTVIIIIANNYILVPYLSIFWPEYIKVLVLPESLWNLLVVGVGGYVVGRTGEKMMDSFKRPQDK